MKFIALLRGVNVGGSRRVEMKRLGALFGSIGSFNVSTYLNSGNVLFEIIGMDKGSILKFIVPRLKKTFGSNIPILIKTASEMSRIAKAIPKEWQNDEIQKTDVGYLFDEVDSKKILEELSVNKEFVDIRYVKGAIYWNVLRKNYNKSRLNKLVGHKVYQLMTMRNVNTARFLGGLRS